MKLSKGPRVRGGDFTLGAILQMFTVFTKPEVARERGGRERERDTHTYTERGRFSSFLGWP